MKTIQRTYDAPTEWAKSWGLAGKPARRRNRSDAKAMASRADRRTARIALRLGKEPAPKVLVPYNFER